MIFLVYCETSADTVSRSLGLPDYSYYFILNKYLPMLERLGKVVYISDPAVEVDAQFDEAAASGNSAVFLSFTPPHRTTLGLRCPTVCVLAWEFESIPDESWDSEEPRNNWVYAINEIGNVLTISDFATRVIRRQVDRSVRVFTIPAPIAIDAEYPVREKARSGVERRLTLAASVIDSRRFEISSEAVSPLQGEKVDGYVGSEPWDGRPVEWTFSARDSSAGQYLVGFYGLEEWGCWSRTRTPSIILPSALTGEVELSLQLLGYGENQGKLLTVSLGDEQQALELPGELETVSLRFRLQTPASSIRFSGHTPVALPGARDSRTLGFGLASLRIAPAGTGNTAHGELAAASSEEPGATQETLEFAGAVYTSVFNPVDGRKNWHDMVTAFCWAFRHDRDRTLVLKMSHHNKAAFMGELLLLFSRLWPFECRIVAIHGFLEQEQFDQLMGCTDFFVNTSNAEGQCLPLLEFMSHGVPAVAPRHTAMLSYVDPSNAFVVDSSRQPAIWPNDPRKARRTFSHRIDWDSLQNAFQASAGLLEDSPSRYAEMSRTAHDTVARLYSLDTVTAQFRKAIRKITGRSP